MLDKLVLLLNLMTRVRQQQQQQQQAAATMAGRQAL
jgi:hypothetical protein